MAIPPAMMKEQEDIRNRFTCALFSSFHFFLCFFLPLFFYVVPFCCVGKRSRSSLLVSLFESKSEEKKERMKRERERERERENEAIRTENENKKSACGHHSSDSPNLY